MFVFSSKLSKKFSTDKQNQKSKTYHQFNRRYWPAKEYKEILILYME